jgi:hypothetical protein
MTERFTSLSMTERMTSLKSPMKRHALCPVSGGVWDMISILNHDACAV